MIKKIILLSLFAISMIIIMTGCSFLFGDYEPAATDELTIELGQEEFIYNGTAIEPVPVVKFGTSTIDSGNYNITYANNIDAGTATITLDIDDTKFKGIKNFTFTIKPKQFEVEHLTCELVQTYQYTGNPIIPTLSNVCFYTTELNTNDYELTATNNIGIGNATLTITGINNYSGSGNINFQIIKRDVSTLTANAYPDLITYEINEVYTPAITQIKDGDISLNLLENTDYTLTYENNDAIGQGSIIVTGKEPNCDSTKSFVVYFEITVDTVYQIAFHSVEGENFDTISKKYNQNVYKPDDKPIKQNQTINWYEDSLFTIPFYFDKMPIIDNATNTKLLYGKWEDEQGMHFFDKDYSAANIEINSREELIQLIDYITYKHITTIEETPLFHLTYVNNSERQNEISAVISNYRMYPTMKIGTSMVYYDNETGDIKVYLDATKTIFEPNKNTGELEVEYQYTQLESLNATTYVSERTSIFDDFAINSQTQSIDTITTSNQLYFTLEYRLKPLCATNSTAERLYNEMKDVLREIIDDRMSDYEKVKAIYDYLVLNVVYDYKALDIVYDPENHSDPNNPAYYNCYYLEGVFDDNRAVCDGISKAFISLCQIEGIDCVRIVGEANHGESIENHAWNKVKINNQWYIVDATWGNTGLSSDKTEYLNYQHFLTSETIKQSYGCTGYKYNNINCFGNIEYYKNANYSVEDKSIVADYYIESQTELNDLFYYCFENNIDPLTDKTVNFYIAFDYGSNGISDELLLSKTSVFNRTGEVFDHYSWSIPETNNHIITIIFG